MLRGLSAESVRLLNPPAALSVPTAITMWEAVLV